MNTNKLRKMNQISLLRNTGKSATDLIRESMIYSKDNLVLNYLINYQNLDPVRFCSGQEYEHFMETENSKTQWERCDIEKRICCNDYAEIRDASLLRCLDQRRSVRQYNSEILGRDLMSLLTNVVSTRENGDGRVRRVYPSGGGLYPIKLILYLQGIIGIEDGVYYYDSVSNELGLSGIKLSNKDVEKILEGQNFTFKKSKIIIFYVFDLLQSYIKYADISLSLGFIEVGAITQTIQLLAPIYNMGVCDVGGFPKQRIEKKLNMNSGFFHLVHINVVGGII